MMSEELLDGAASARPFPWFCPKCRRKEVRRVTVPYQCELLHEGRPVAVILPNLGVPKCGNCGELVFDYEADDQINRAFAATVKQGSGLPPLAPPTEPSMTALEATSIGPMSCDGSTPFHGSGPELGSNSRCAPRTITKLYVVRVSPVTLA